MKNTTLFIAISLLLFKGIQAQTISPYLFGQNAWMPDSIGTMPRYGQLANNWQKVKDSHCVSVRIGGKGYDKNSVAPNGGPATTYQLLTLINAIQINGGEPIVQIDYADSTYTATQAAAVVTAINIANLSSIQRKVKYWTIGNEPDNYTISKTAPKIAAYTKAFSAAMKLADSTIKIIAPELSEYNKPTNSGILSTLLGGGTYDITGLVPGHTYYYADYISFHYYPFSGSQTRTSVISTITSANGFNWQLGQLAGLLSLANGSRSSSPLQMAITEGNINYPNSSTSADSALSGVGANSFIAGQFWAEMLAKCMENNVQFMNFWSVIEGDGSTPTTDIGYLRQTNASKRSTWYHFNLLANSFKGSYSPGTVSTGQTKFKGFGSYDGDQIAVMIMNQRDSASSYSYTIRFDNSANTGSGTVKIKVPGPNIAIQYTDTLDDQSTTLLVFDRYGNITTKTRYKLTDNYNPPSNRCGTAKIYANQAALSTSNTPGGVYSSITIGGAGSGAITIDANYNTVFKAVGTITIDGTGGTFSSGSSSLNLLN